MDIFLILISITGLLIGVFILKEFKIYKRIIIVIGIDLFLYVFHAPIVYIGVVLATSILKIQNIDLYYWVGMGMFLSFAILTPMYAYSIDRYVKDKKVLNFIVSLLISTIIFITLLCLFMIVSN